MPKHIPKVSDVVKASCPKNGAVINIGSFSVSGKNDIPRNNSRVEMEERFDVWKDSRLPKRDASWMARIRNCGDSPLAISSTTGSTLSTYKCFAACYSAAKLVLNKN